MDRRRFILTSGATALATQTAAGANARVQMAVVGVRSRGREHVDLFARHPDSRVVAVCHIDDAQTERAVPLAEKAQGSRPKRPISAIGPAGRSPSTPTAKPSPAMRKRAAC